MNIGDLLLSGMGCMGAGVSGSQNAEGGSQWYIIVIYIVVFVVFIYFIMVRPNKKRRQKEQDTQNSMAPGDSVLTTSGMYGTIVSVTPDTVIVEFGNNKNCRIPMAKAAISQVEKAGGANTGAAPAAQSEASKKKFFERAEKAEEEAAAQIEAADAKAEETAGEALEAADAASETTENEAEKK